MSVRNCAGERVRTPCGRAFCNNDLPEGVVVRQNAPADGAVQNVLDDPEDAVAGTFGKSRVLQCKQPGAERFRRDLRQRTRTENGQNVTFQMMCVRAPASFVFPDERQIDAADELFKEHFASG